MSEPSRPGALVISLDFELHWGMRDNVGPGDRAFRNLLASRQVVRDLSALFASRGIRATWATVGFLFASTKDELSAHLPSVRPTYRHPELDPYVEHVGSDETADPEHLAGSLVDLLARTPGQEVASHTHSHFYCLESGQDEDAFRADLAMAQAMAQFRGFGLTSLVLPRNQWNPRYAKAVKESGFNCYRGPQLSRGHEARRKDEQSQLTRASRILDTYGGFSPPPTTSWAAVPQPDGLYNVPASAFLRPYDPRRRIIEPLRRARLLSGLRDAAHNKRIFHLWWHPHNFVDHRQHSFDLLNYFLDEHDRLTQTDGLRSMSMRDVAEECQQVDLPAHSDHR